VADNKFAAYLCAGCGLGDVLDIDGLEKIAKKEGKMQVVKHHDFLCSAAGVQMIRDDIANEGISHLMIGACSRRAKTEAFNFPDVSVARANLREGVIWIVAEGATHDEVRQEMADDYVRMGCAELKKMLLPAGSTGRGTNKRILVVGGGVSGLTAAIEAAETGYEVVLVEKAPALGGWAASLWKRVPYQDPYAEPQATGIEELIARVSLHPGITVHLGATLAETAGAPGRFAVKIAQESGAVVQEMVGAIIQASGFSTYDMARLPELGAGLPGVVDQAGLEALAQAARGGAIERADGQVVQSVVFVQCAGQRDETGTHLPYCSGHCCATSVKQAMYFKDANPDIDTVVLYTDLRLPGMSEDFYRSAQRKGVTFTKGKVSQVKAQGAGCTVSFRDLILDEDATVDADLVVLATGQVPNSGVNIDIPEDQQPEVKPISILNLTYRQGKDLPQLKAGLTDSHFICFPYETRRTGIYAAGPVRRPMDMQQATDDATGAALKAIQAVENAMLGRAAHPRSGDLSYPIVRLEGCTQCKRCTVECPFGAIDEDERRFPVFNESRCRRCGTCMGACPVRVISFENYSTDTVGSQIKSLDMPDEFSERPRILLLACENDAYPALDMAGLSRTVYSAFVRAIPVRCLGSVNTIWITDALNSGWDGVMMMGCKKGDDYQCHFVKGSELAHYRMSKIDDTLKGMGLEPERVASYEVAITDHQRVAALINDYAEKIKELGMSPMKGFN